MSFKKPGGRRHNDNDLGANNVVMPLANTVSKTVQNFENLYTENFQSLHIVNK